MRTNRAPFVRLALSGLAIAATAPVASALSFEDQMVATARKYLGVPYKFGADMVTDVPHSFDCSAFTMYIHGLYNMKIPRGANAQSNVGRPVARTALRKGDLVFFDFNGDGTMNHVAMYIGDNRMIHTYKVGVGVAITPLWGSWWGNRYAKARRMLPESGIPWTVQSITTTKAVLRTGPGTDFSVAGIAHKGERYVQVGFHTPYGTYWKRINFNGKTAWMGSGSCATIVGGKAVFVTGTRLNVRTGPGLGNQDIGDVFRDQFYAWFQTSTNGWHRIAFNGGYGWVSGTGSGTASLY